MPDHQTFVFYDMRDVLDIKKKLQDVGNYVVGSYHDLSLATAVNVGTCMPSIPVNVGTYAME